MSPTDKKCIISLESLRGKKQQILALSAARRIANVRIFGSVARGEANSESDIDFLVDPNPDCSGFDLGGLQYDLETLLQHSVDVVTPNGLHWYIRDDVLSHAVAL